MSAYFHNSHNSPCAAKPRELRHERAKTLRIRHTLMTIRFGPTKKPFILSGRTKSVIYSRGATFVRQCLAAPTSVGMGHRNVPLPARPLTEASGAVLLSRFAISSGSLGFFFAVCVLWAFHHLPTLWKPRELLLFPSKPLAC